MSSKDKLKAFVCKHGFQLPSKKKTKVQPSDVSNSAKQKELLLQIASDLGYIK